MQHWRHSEVVMTGVCKIFETQPSIFRNLGVAASEKVTLYPLYCTVFRYFCPRFLSDRMLCIKRYTVITNVSADWRSSLLFRLTSANLMAR